MHESGYEDVPDYINHKTEALSRFEEWFLNNGGYLHPACEFAFKPNGGYFLRVKHEWSELASENGSRTTVPAGTVVISCPHALTLSALNVLGEDVNLAPPKFHDPTVDRALSDLLGKDARPQSLAGVTLTVHMALNDRSKWQPYLRLLPRGPSSDGVNGDESPQDGEIDCPVWWPEDSRAMLAGTALEKGIEDLIKVWYDDWEASMKDFQSLLIEGFGNDIIFTNFKWAMTILNSRAFSSSLLSEVRVVRRENGSDTQPLLERCDPRMLLYPGVDLLNHSAYTKNYWHYDSERFGIVCDDEPSPGEEVFNSYGSKTNGQLLLSWGFVIPDNPHDGFPLKLSKTSDVASNNVNDVDHPHLVGRSNTDPVKSQNRQRFPHAADIENSVYYIRMFQSPMLLAPGYCSEFPELFGIPHALLSNLTFNIANDRERLRLKEPSHKPQVSIYMRAGKRNVLAAVAMLHKRLIHEHQRLIKEPRPAQNGNLEILYPRQEERGRLVSTYREGQRKILESNIAQLKNFLSRSLMKSFNGESTCVVNLSQAVKWLEITEVEAGEAFTKGLEVLYGTRDLERLRDEADELDLWALWISLALQARSNTSSALRTMNDENASRHGSFRWIQALHNFYIGRAQMLCKAHDIRPSTPTEDIHFEFATEIGSQIAQIYSTLLPNPMSTWWRPPPGFLSHRKDNTPQRKRQRRKRSSDEDAELNPTSSTEMLIVCAMIALDETLVLDPSVYHDHFELMVEHEQRVLYFELPSRGDIG